MQGFFEEGVAGQFVLVRGAVEEFGDPLGGHVQHPFHFGGKIGGRGGGIQAGAVFPEVVADGGQPLVAEVVGRFLARQPEQLVDVLRHGEQRGSEIEAVVAEAELG